MLKYEAERGGGGGGPEEEEGIQEVQFKKEEKINDESSLCVFLYFTNNNLLISALISALEFLGRSCAIRGSPNPLMFGRKYCSKRFEKKIGK